MNKKLKRFLHYYRPHKKALFTDLLCAFTASMIVLIYPLLVRYVTSTAQSTGIKMDIVLLVGAVFFALAILEYLCNYYITYIGHFMGVKMEFDMRKDLFNHLQKLSFSYYDNVKTGQLMSRLTNDLFDVTELAHHGPEDVIISIVKMIGSIIILLFINVPLTLAIVIILPFMFLFALYHRKKMRIAFSKNRVRVAEINSQIEDSLSGIRVVKSFANEHIELEKFLEGNKNYVESKKRSYKAMSKFHSGLSFFISLINIVLVVVGSWFITMHIITVTDLVTFLLYINLLIEPIKKLINFTEQFQNGATGFERFLNILDIEPDIVDSKNAVEINDVKGNIEFKNVTFSYDNEESKVLNNLELKISAGDYVALVGPSGVGKTTLCSLIPRFYEPESGLILIDGKDISKIKLKSLREHIGIVQQDVYLFAGTVKENIAYGKINATDEEIIQAAINANAHEFISQLPNGYDTYIGQRGIKLSGGQKQRLSIARVFLKNPPILIFDEATSSLDNESEKIVQESLEKLTENRTTICIAHRLSTIKNAEKILVLTEEGITESGTHDELIQKNGVYSNYYSLNNTSASM